MANSRLYIYDKETNSACCIARGSSTWFTGGTNDNINEFFDYAPEYVCDVKKTRYELKMEHEIYAMKPQPKVFYEK